MMVVETLKPFILLFILPPIITYGIETQWPEGTYGLPKAKQGCPSDDHVVWKMGFRRHQTSYGCHSSPQCHLAGSHEGNSSFIVQEFCVKVDPLSDNTFKFSSGEYCIFKKGLCPFGFESGWIYWDDTPELIYYSQTIHGHYPDGRYGRNTYIEYCCRADGDTHRAIKLPSQHPFFLMQRGNHCQEVEGMSVREEWLHWKDSQFLNKNSQGGLHPRLNRTTNPHTTTLFYCYYQPLSYDESKLSPYSAHNFPPISIGRDEVLRVVVVVAVFFVVALFMALLITVIQRFKEQRKHVNNNNSNINLPVCRNRNKHLKAVNNNAINNNNRNNNSINDNDNNNSIINNDNNNSIVNSTLNNNNNSTAIRNNNINSRDDLIENAMMTSPVLPAYQETRDAGGWSQEPPPSYQQALSEINVE